MTPSKKPVLTKDTLPQTLHSRQSFRDQNIYMVPNLVERVTVGNDATTGGGLSIPRAPNKRRSNFSVSRSHMQTDLSSLPPPVSTLPGSIFSPKAML